MPEGSRALAIVEPDLEWLTRRQGLDPGNAFLAHDLGLACYWQAKAAGESEAALVHWRRVIGAWGQVLESDSFWNGWAERRGRVYGRAIAAQEVAAAKGRLTQRVLEELADYEGSRWPGGGRRLTAAFALEREGERMLKQGGGLRLAGREGEGVSCGPLWMEQLGLEGAVRAYFAGRAGREQDRAATLERILRPIRAAGEEAGAGRVDVARECMVVFSGLGLAMICVRQGDGEAALALLAEQQCAECHGAAGVGRVVARCREGCARFERVNPSYAAVVRGREWHERDAAELTAAAHLVWAEQLLAAGEVGEALKHSRQALTASQGLGVQERLRGELGEHLLSWADRMQRAGETDRAIGLLEELGDFDSSGTWKSRLSLSLNERGVGHADAGRWEEGLADLRRACALSPYLDQIRKNLVNVLGAAAAGARGVDQARAGELEKERDRVQQGGVPNAGPEPRREAGPSDPSRRDGENASPPPTSVLDPPELFDTNGMLDRNRFDDTTFDQVVRPACEKAFAGGRAVLDLSDLAQALGLLPDSQLKSSLAGQPDAFERLCQSTQTTWTEGPANSRLEQGKPSFFDLWIGAIDVLRRAAARVPEGRALIGEAEILHGLLASPYAIARMQAAGVASLPARVAWRPSNEEPSHE